MHPRWPISRYRVLRPANENWSPQKKRRFNDFRSAFEIILDPLLNFGFQHHSIFQGGDVLLDGAHFERIPREGITISTWVKLDTNKGIQSIFDTVGGHSKHKDGQYHFEIENGKVRWFHRNENHDTIFSLLTRPAIREGVWTQITATYSANKQRARVSSVIAMDSEDC